MPIPVVWAGPAEHPALCPGPLAAVRDNEVVARLLHENTLEPASSRFMRKEVFSVGLTSIDNQCGTKDGASVDRCDNLSDDEIMRRSKAQAERRPGRKAEGAYYATAGGIRRLRLPGQPDAQIFRVYDDARLVEDEFGPINCEHAVVRGDDALSRPQQSGALALIISLFIPERPSQDTQLDLPLAR